MNWWCRNLGHWWKKLGSAWCLSYSIHRYKCRICKKEIECKA